MAQRASRTHPGFTIVELLIVIVVIAILAAITIVSYNGIVNRARGASAASAARSASDQVQLYAVSNNSQLPNTLSDAGVTDSNGTTFQYRTYNGGANYCLTATVGQVSYYTDNDTQTTPAAGACAGQAVNGGVVATNLVQNASGVQYLPVTTAANVLNDRYSVYVTYSANNASSGLPANVSKYFHSTVNTAFSGVHGYDLGVNPDGTTATAGTPVTAGTTYMVSGYVRWSGSTTVPSAYIVYAWYDSSNNRIGSNTAGTIFTTSSANTWYRLSQAVTAPAGAASMGITFRRNVGTNAVGDTFDLAGPMITAGSSLYSYADGNSPNWIWNGTSDASTSTGPAS